MKAKSKKQQTQSVYEAFAFTLSGHTKLTGVITVPHEQFQHVTGELYSWPKIAFKPSPATRLDDGENARKQFHVYTSPKHESVVVASADAEKALGTLAMLARNGDGKALWQFAEIVRNAVAGLNQIAESNPGAIRPFSRRSMDWPMLRSTAPLLCTDEALLKTIELGAEVPAQLDQHSKWKPDHAADVAIQLFNHIEAVRRENPVVLENGKRIKFATCLPSFCQDTAADWWSVAKKFFIAAYPRPEEVAELDALVTTASKRKSPGRRRTAIREKIRDRFTHLACLS